MAGADLLRAGDLGVKMDAAEFRARLAPEKIFGTPPTPTDAMAVIIEARHASAVTDAEFAEIVEEYIGEWGTLCSGVASESGYR